MGKLYDLSSITRRTRDTIYSPHDFGFSHKVLDGIESFLLLVLLADQTVRTCYSFY